MRLRRKTDHQIGFLVMEDGEQRVRLDRGTTKMSDTSTQPYREQEWEPAPKVNFTDMQIARICYDADRAYRIARGDYGVPEWNALRDDVKRAAVHPPNTEDDVRLGMFADIRSRMRDA